MCRRKALMGLIDDVDCAVVSLEASLSTPSSALAHLASIPAFAWVTTGEAEAPMRHKCRQTCACYALGDTVLRCHAGKVQRKFVLLAEPGSAVAAVIVELQKFAFVYYAVPSQSSHGLHQACCCPAPTCSACIAGNNMRTLLLCMSAEREVLLCRLWTWACPQRSLSQVQRCSQRRRGRGSSLPPAAPSEHLTCRDFLQPCLNVKYWLHQHPTCICKRGC